MSFKDHFSAKSDNYSRYRPNYPEQLFADIASHCREKSLVWDVGTGSGQAAIAWTHYFKQVIASDASDSQIANATAHDQVEYHVWPAEKSALPDQCVDLVTIAQALHWFDFERFYAEVRRVLKPNGVIAAWCYTRPNSDDASVSAVLEDFYFNIVGPYWPKERDWVDDHYQTIPFPFTKIAMPSYRIEFQWDLEQLLGYLDTWSASKAFEKANGFCPTEKLKTVLSPLFDNAAIDNAPTLTINWPIYVILGINKG